MAIASTDAYGLFTKRILHSGWSSRLSLFILARLYELELENCASSCLGVPEQLDLQVTVLTFQ